MTKGINHDHNQNRIKTGLIFFNHRQRLQKNDKIIRKKAVSLLFFFSVKPDNSMTIIKEIRVFS